MNDPIELTDCSEVHEDRRFEVTLKIGFTTHVPKLDDPLDATMTEVMLGMRIHEDLAPYLALMEMVTDDFAVEVDTRSEVVA